MESCKGWIFVYIEFFLIFNVMVFGIYRDRMIRIIKRSLCEVTHCKIWFKIFIWEKFFVSLEREKLLKPEFMRDTSEFDWLKEMYLIDILKDIYRMHWNLKCFEIFWCCLYWFRAYETLLGRSRKKRGVVLLLRFYYSHRRRLFLQSM